MFVCPSPKQHHDGGVPSKTESIKNIQQLGAAMGGLAGKQGWFAHLMDGQVGTVAEMACQYWQILE